jgi:hypothetical protein
MRLRAFSVFCLAVLLLSGCGRSDTAAQGDPATPQKDVGATDADGAKRASASAATTANDAEVVLAAALDQARSAKKRVLVHLSAPW